MNAAVPVEEAPLSDEDSAKRRAVANLLVGGVSDHILNYKGSNIGEGGQGCLGLEACAPVCNRITGLKNKSSCLCGFNAGLGKTKRWIGSKSHVTSLTTELITQHPCFAT